MRIVVNSIASSSGGALTVLKSFYNHLIESEQNNKHEWIFLLSGKHLVETNNIKIIILDKVKKSWKNRLYFDFIEGKNIISKLKPDIVLSLQNTITVGLKCQQVIYMHQAIPFQKEKKFSFFKKKETKLAIYQHLIGKIIKISIKKADRIIVQTNWIRDAIIEETKIDLEKIRVFLPPFEKKNVNKIQKPFESNMFFYPAANLLYKNHECIYNASLILNKENVNDFKVFLTIDQEEPKKNISHLGELSLSEVIEKYNTTTLVFPSYIETLGLPLLEAKQVGTIILAADCPYSREILGDYVNAYFFDPFNPYELAELMNMVMNNELERKEVKSKKTKAHNSWEDVIEFVINEKKEILTVEGD